MPEKEPKSNAWLFGMPTGFAIGVGLATATDNVAFGFVWGIGLGVVVSLILRAVAKIPGGPRNE
ncbi:hypothetical protein [Parvularcula lutaonensis]|uniref:Uncharacterized protein n=1 Tax=Parvularcula lutaonensis TaxID=491923 RepID=A0ABV7MF38_9PROT|nr:hypothetical protein [Parvularcula lutaonensis]GGY54845.1 hypothetical protein GCM10007148_25730 [Parvularcula lutaonensis]